MKTNSTERVKKTTREGEASEPTATAPANSVSAEPTGAVKYGAEGPSVMPDPQALLLEAEQEPNYRDLEDYTAVISKLREKGFTYRDIAEWLKERGVEIDHNAVYRVYVKNMSDGETYEESERAEDEARAEAMKNR